MTVTNTDALYRPAQVILLRHAEKPSSGPELSEIGFRRAQLIPHYFQTHSNLMEFGPPEAIIAASPSRVMGSIRSIQTVAPLASRFELPVNDRFKKDEIAPLASALFNTPRWHNRTVVVCWNRQGLPELAQKLGANAPIYWDKNCFNKFWIIRYKDELAPQFFEIHQD